MRASHRLGRDAKDDCYSAMGAINHKLFRADRNRSAGIFALKRNGSLSWIRTNGRSINSRELYR